MTTYTRIGRKRGFTLVELMIVVAIIGVLAALAIYGVKKYLTSAKTSEAKNTIGGIARAAAAKYNAQRVGSQLLDPGNTGTGATQALCNSAGAVPSTGAPAGAKYQPDPADGNDFNTGNETDGWRCLKFGVNEPIFFQYSYIKDGTWVATANPAVPTATANAFEAAATGDLDGDNSAYSVFARTGQVVAGELILATEVYEENADE